MSRLLYLVVGFGFLALAIVGIALPVLPTTPFLLVAATCFAKSSHRCHQWLLDNRLFGPIIQNWQHNRCIPKKSKQLAIMSIFIFGGSSVVFFVPSVFAQLATLVLLSIGLWVVTRLKTCP